MESDLSTANAEEATQPRGIGGWLHFPAAITFLNALNPVLEMASLYFGLQKPQPNDPGIVYIYASDVLMLILWTWVCILLAKRKRIYPKVFIYLSTAYILLLIGFSLVAYAAGQPDWESTTKIGLTLFFFNLVWIPYLLFSRRVKNTFVN